MWMRLLLAAQKIISQQLQISLLPYHSLGPNLQVQFQLTKSTKGKRNDVQADVQANFNQDRCQINLAKTCVCRIKVVKAL